MHHFTDENWVAPANDFCGGELLRTSHTTSDSHSERDKSKAAAAADEKKEHERKGTETKTRISEFSPEYIQKCMTACVEN